MEDILIKRILDNQIAIMNYIIFKNDPLVNDVVFKSLLDANNQTIELISRYKDLCDDLK